MSLDDLLLHPDQPNRSCVVDFETRSLREVREKIAAGGLQAGYASAERVSGGLGHPRLWRLLVIPSSDLFHCFVLMGLLTFLFR